MPTAAPDLPEGRVTMLFTDIEGSTAHLRRLGNRYGEVLADQRRILRTAIADHGGHEMGTEGDSFFVVFAEATEGLAAAVEAQRALDANPWTGGAPIRVRMGLHCGDLTRHDEGYVGLELNRAARIASTGNGGQIVVSAAMRDAVGAAMPVEYRDLGLHRLKDLPAAERIYQVLADGFPDIATPIKSLGAASNLPVSRAELVGRGDDVASVVSRVDAGARLVTLTGPGGVGKTALAVAAAAALERRFAGGGIYFVDLAGATTAADAWSAIGDAIGIDADAGATDADAAVERALEASGQTLVVLDNLEQLVDAASVAASLLEAAPALQILATSRGPLRLSAEQQYPVATLSEGDAVDLFVREARRVRPAFDPDPTEHAAIVELCRRVDGLPLAIAVVASRIRHFGVAAIARSLDERLDVASRDVDRPDRHRSLFAAVAWSAGLLEPTMQRQFASLSVLVGGGSVEAAAAVLGVDELEAFDVLDALADLSLIAFADGPDGSARIALLHVVREYATSLLQAAPEAEAAARGAHARHYADLAEDAEARLHGAEQQAAGDRLALEHDNLRAAFEWAHAGGPDARRLAGRIAAALGWFWYTHGRAAEGRRWLERTAAWDLETLDPALALRTAQALGVLRQQQGENGAALVSFGRALELAEAAGDDAAAARARNSLGITHWAEGRLDLAREHLEESVAIGRRLDDEQRVAAGLSNLGIVLLTGRDHDAAVAVLRDALVIDRRRGDDWGVAVDQINLGTALVGRGDLVDGMSLLQSTLARAQELGDPDLFASGVEACAIVAAVSGHPRDAVALVAGADRIRSSASAPRAPSEDAYLERELGPARAELTRAEVDEIVSGAPDGEAELLALVAVVAERLAEPGRSDR